MITSSGPKVTYSDTKVTYNNLLWPTVTYSDL